MLTSCVDVRTFGDALEPIPGTAVGDAVARLAIKPMANAGGVPESLRWGHAEAISGFVRHSMPWGQKPSVQRLWRRGTRLLASCGVGRTGSQRQVGTTVVRYGMSQLHFDLAKAGSGCSTKGRGTRAWATVDWCLVRGGR